MSWGRCPGGEAECGTLDVPLRPTHRGLAEGRQLGRHHKSGVCESVRCLGKMQLLQPGPACTCPKKEGGRRPSHNAAQPASGQPQADGKEV